jgi:hypothetical protein
LKGNDGTGGKMEPSKEQIKEFWEWCGFKKLDNPTADVKWAYCYPDGNLYSFKSFPPIDLNNLFKWAVPKLINKDGQGGVAFRQYPDGLMCVIALESQTGFDEHKIFRADKDPALALFWAIYKVIKEGHEGNK